MDGIAMRVCYSPRPLQQTVSEITHTDTQYPLQILNITTPYHFISNTTCVSNTHGTLKAQLNLHRLYVHIHHVDTQLVFAHLAFPALFSCMLQHELYIDICVAHCETGINPPATG